jgi:hypothetical protein
VSGGYVGAEAPSGALPARAPRIGGGPYPARLVAWGVLALAALALLACGGSAPSSKAVAELRRVAPLRQDLPVLVFVYTDG